MTRFAFFDLDHTLLSGDSDVLWCEWLMREGLLERETFAPRNAAMEAAYPAGTVSVHEFSGFYVGTLAGRSPAQALFSSRVRTTDEPGRAWFCGPRRRDRTPSG